jgi:hypothetical protein
MSVDLPLCKPGESTSAGNRAFCRHGDRLGPFGWPVLVAFGTPDVKALARPTPDQNFPHRCRRVGP